MRLTKIEAWGLKGRDLAHDLEPVAFFTGPNGWGKTTRLQTVEAALRDYHGVPPYVTGKAKVRLTFDAPLVVERTFSGGRQRLLVTPDDRGGVRENQAYLEHVLGLSPEVWDLGVFLGLSAAGRVEYLAGVAGRAAVMDREQALSVLDNAPDEIRRELEALWTDGMDVLAWTQRAKAALKDLYTHYNRRRKEAKAALGQFAVAADAAGQQAGVLKQQLAQLRQQHEELVSRQAAARAEARERTRLERDLDEVRRKITRYEALATDTAAAEQELEAVNRELADLVIPDGDVNALRKELEKLNSLREDLIARTRLLEQRQQDTDEKIRMLSDGVCPVCGATGAHVSMVLAQTRDRLVNIRTEAGRVGADLQAVAVRIRETTDRMDDVLFQRDLARAKKNKLTAKRDELTEQIKRLRAAAQELDELRKKAAELEQTLENLPEVQDETVNAAQLEALKERIRDLESRIARYEEARAQGLAYERTLQDRDKAEDAFEAVKRLRVALKDLERDVMAGALKPVEAAADELLDACGEDFRFRVDADVPNIGLQRGNLWIPYEALSGSEQALAGAALTYALAVVGDRPWKVLLLDGIEALDDERVPRFLRGIMNLTESGRLDNALLAGILRPQPELLPQNIIVSMGPGACNPGNRLGG